VYNIYRSAAGDQVIMLDNTLAQKRVYDVGDGPLSLSLK